MSVLTLLNEDSTISAMVDGIVRAVQACINVQAVGIRLREGDQFAFIASTGFSGDFLEAESKVSCPLNSGESSLVFDDGGTVPDVDVQGHYLREGYQSIAWVPLRARQEILGLMLLCDRRPNQFCTDIIRFLEAMSAGIGLAIARKRTEQGLFADGDGLNAPAASIAALHRQEARQNTIISNISDVVAIIDEQGVTRFKSSNLSKRFGWRPEEIVGKPALAHVHADDLSGIREQLAALRAQPGGTATTVCRYRCKNGTYKWIELNAVNLLDDPNISGILLNYHDISERQRAQAALNESEERYRILFQNSRDALLTIAPPTWQVAECNAAAVAMFGLANASDFESKTLWEISPEFQPDGTASQVKAIAILEAVMRDGACSFEWVHRNAKGEEFPANLSVAMVELNSGPLLQVTVRDESERRRLFAQMTQADRLASMGMLAGGLAHEINNPLAFVRYNIESLAEDVPRLTGAIRHARDAIRVKLGECDHRQLLGEASELFEDASLSDISARVMEALAGVERIVSITRALSTFSRVEQCTPTKVDVAVAIQAAVNLAHNEVAHRARLSSTVETLPCVWASEGKLSHAFMNLIVNAALRIDEGDVANNLIAIHAWSEGEQVIVEVTDTGREIEPDKLDHIFEPFYATEALGSGPGLGLSISKSLLAEFGGTLAIHSTAGIGNRFTVHLPVMKEVFPPNIQVHVPPPHDNAQAQSRILVIDDEPNVIKVLKRALGKDYSIVSVTCGRQAQELVATDRNFDVILCDLVMPQVSGTEFHAWLLERDATLANRVVFITGGAFTPKSRDYLTRVSNPTLEKPFSAAGLRQQVEKVIRGTDKRNPVGHL